MNMAEFARRTLLAAGTDPGRGQDVKSTPLREIAFIDRKVDDLPTLLAGLRPDVDAILLHEASTAPAQIAHKSSPAPAQIAKALEGPLGADAPKAVHVIAHGSPGPVSFAPGALSIKNLSEHEADLARIGVVLGRLAESLEQRAPARRGGRAFVEAFAKAAAIRVAASNRPVGAAGRGGAGSFGLGLPAPRRTVWIDTARVG